MNKIILALIIAWIPQSGFSEGKKKEAVAKPVSKSAVAKIKVPKLKKDEVAIFDNDRYVVTKFVKFENVEFDEACLKKNKERKTDSKQSSQKMNKDTKGADKSKGGCEAFRLSQEKIEFPNPKDTEFMNHPAASYCTNLSGRAIVGIAADGAEVDLCKFSDNSYFKSWGAFYRHFPNEVITK